LIKLARILAQSAVYFSLFSESRFSLGF